MLLPAPALRRSRTVELPLNSVDCPVRRLAGFRPLGWRQSPKWLERVAALALAIREGTGSPVPAIGCSRITSSHGEFLA